MTAEVATPIKTRRRCLDWLTTNHVDEVDAITIYRLIGFALDEGYTVSVHDGEEIALAKSTDRPAIIWAMVSTDGDDLIFHNIHGTNRIGSVSLVYGNEPGVVISDHTDNAAINALVERAQDHEARREAYPDDYEDEA